MPTGTATDYDEGAVRPAKSWHYHSKGTNVDLAFTVDYPEPIRCGTYKQEGS